MRLYCKSQAYISEIFLSGSFSPSLVVAHREWCMKGSGGAASQMGWWVGFRGYRRGRWRKRCHLAVVWWDDVSCPSPTTPTIHMATCLVLYHLLYKLQVITLQVQLQVTPTPALPTGNKSYQLVINWEPFYCLFIKLHVIPTCNILYRWIYLYITCRLLLGNL